MSGIKITLLSLVLFCWLALNAENIITLSQAKTLKKEGIAAYHAKDYHTAIQNLEQASSAYKHFGKALDYLSCLEILSLSYEHVGQYDKAIAAKEEQMEIHSTLYSDQDSNYAMHLGALAHLYSLKGKYDKAISYAKEALELKKKVYGKESDEYRTALYNMGYYYSCLGNYEIATSYMSEVGALIEKTAGKDSPEYADYLNYFSSICFRLELYDWALELTNRCVVIISNYQDDIRYPIYLQNLALYMYAADHSRANESIELAKQSLELQKSRGIANTPFYGKGLVNMLSYYIETAQYEEAERYGLEALELFKNLYGDFHPDITGMRVNLSALYVRSNQKQKAAKLISQTTEGYYYQTKNAFKYLTKEERSYYWLRYEPWCLVQLPYYAFELKNDEVTECCYDATLFSKGLLLNSEKEITDLIKESGDSVLLQDYMDLQQLNNVINSLSQIEGKTTHLDLDSLKSQANSKEQSIMAKSSIYGDYTKNLSIKWSDVQQKLGNGDIAIEFVSFPYNKGNNYIALLIKQGWPSPKLIPIYYNDSISSNDYLYLSEQIWSPLLPELENVKNIYFAPSGKLHGYPIESFPLSGGKAFISDKYHLFRLSSTRELAVEKHIPVGKDAVVYGGLVFDIDISEMKADANMYYQNVTRDASHSIILDTFELTTLREHLHSLPELRGTKIEAEQIVSIMKKTQGFMEVEKYMGKHGTETSFKSLSGQKKRIIHIATHGFYLSNDSIKLTNLVDAAAVSLGHEINDVRSVEDKSLARSGLFFAGADNKLQGEVIPEGLDDGILTAQEISTLDLRGLDLVSLSACQTAQGDIMSDGVFGLQRGFKKAGANSILMSLWKVDDNATCLLMTEFYKNWISEGMTKHNALELAKQAVRSHTEKGWDNPKYWAAFILLDALD